MGDGESDAARATGEERNSGLVGHFGIGLRLLAAAECPCVVIVLRFGYSGKKLN